MAAPSNADTGRPRPSVLLNPGQTRGTQAPAAPAAPAQPAPVAPASAPAAPRQAAAPAHAPAAPRPAAPAAATAPRPAGPRRANLFLTRIDPWSVMKSSFMLSLALAIVLMVALAVLWWTLAAAGVFDAVTRTATDVAGNSTTQQVDNLFSFGNVMGAGLVLSAIEIILITALVTLFGYLYNLMVGITGGLELTLSEEG